jgi:hypothetical protein
MTNQDETPAQPTAKRVRISEDVEILDGPSSKKSETAPSKAAKATVELAVASHPEAIRTIALASSKTYNGQKSKIRNQEHTLKRFDDDDETPGSANLKFTLTAPPEIMENDEFKALAVKMDEAVKTFKSAAKTAIVAVANLRLEHDTTQVKLTLLEAIRNLCEMTLLENNPDYKEPPVAKFSWFVADLMEAKSFEMCYTKRIDVKHEFKRNNDDDMQEDGTQNTSVQISDQEKERFTELAKRVTPILKAIFVDSWNAQIARYREVEITRTLAKKAKELLMEKKAEETQMEIDTESSISAGKIKDLIADAVKKACKKQDGEIQKLTATINRSNPKDKNGKNSNPKNSNRGAIIPTKKTQRAPSTKKKDGKQDGKANPNRRKGRENSPGRQDRDSPKGKKQSSKKSGPDKSRRNSSRSQRPTNQR